MTDGRPRTSMTAIASLVLGLMSLVTGLVAGVPAIISGHVARARIRRSEGALAGRGPATAGMLLGYLMTMVSIAVVLALVSGARAGVSRAQQLEAQQQAVGLKNAIDAFARSYQQLPETGSSDFTTLDPAGQALLRALTGADAPEREPANPRGLRFLDVPEARDGRGGILLGPDGVPNGMADPWGNPYRVILNRPHSEPMRFLYGGSPVQTYGRDVVVASRGPDGREGTDDDLKSWE